MLTGHSDLLDPHRDVLAGEVVHHVEQTGHEQRLRGQGKHRKVKIS